MKLGEVDSLREDEDKYKLKKKKKSEGMRGMCKIRQDEVSES